MIVTCITVYVKEGHFDDFLRATEENHNASVKEPGNLRFDLLQCNNDPSRFFLYEAFKTEEAAAAHKKTAHYLKWKETVAGWMAKPREGVPHKVLRPKDLKDW